MSRFKRRSPPDIYGMHSLKVDNLSYSTRPSDLEKYFGKYGEIGDIYIPRDPRTSESHGFAFVRFFRKLDAEDALDRLDGKIIDGREIRVAFALYARPPQDRAGRPYDRSRSPSRRRRTHSRSRSRDKSRRRERRTPSSASSRSRSPSLRRRSNSPPPKSPEGSSSVGGARSDARSLSK